MSNVLIISETEVKSILKMDDVLKVVEEAFAQEALGKAKMVPKIYLDLPEYNGDFRAMPAYINGSVGVKWVSSYPDNSKSGLPSVIATIILCDPETSYPVAMMGGTYITNMRTGATGGIAVKYLARKGSKTIGIIGAGAQAKTQLIAISKVLDIIDEVKIFDKEKQTSLNFALNMEQQLSINVRSVNSIDEAVDSDILVTTTPSKEPIINRSQVRNGTHINAIGADAKGKQELDVGILRDAKIVVDEMEQAAHSGEINVPLSTGQLKPNEIYGSLGQIVAKTKKNRKNDEEITVFDSTGLAIHDIITAKLVYDEAYKRNLPSINMS